jgi:hypothetical protein
MRISLECCYVGKFQIVNLEKPVVLKVAHDYKNKIFVLQLFKILRSFTRASVLKIESFIVEVTFYSDIVLFEKFSPIPKMWMFCMHVG